MSLLFRKRGTSRRNTILAACAAGASLAPVGSGWAAEFYYQPIVQLSTVYNTNVLLDPVNKQSGEGYFADAATNIGIATPNSITNLQPRLLYNYYPTVSGLNRLEGFLNMNTAYRWARDDFQMTGFYDHRDDLNAEHPAAEDNQVNPGVGTTTPSTGRVLTNTTRDWVILDPQYTHKLTALTSLQLGGEYQRLSYNNQDTAGHVPFNYYLGRIGYNWIASPRIDYTFGVFGARYTAGTIDSDSTTEGVSGQMQFNYSQALSLHLSTSYDHSQVQRTTQINGREENSANTWSAVASAVYTGQITKYHFSIGRSIVPGGNGGLFATDQVQGQYDRDVTPRLKFTAAARLFRDHTVVGFTGNDTRFYSAANFRVQWMMTRTIFVGGTYNAMWQKYEVDTNGAYANRVGVFIGYKGLDRQTQ